MHGRTRKQYVFRFYNIYFQCCVSMKILYHASAKQKTEAVKGFTFYTFIGLFQVTSWQ